MLLPFVGTFAAASFAESWLLNRIGMKAVVTAGAACMAIGPILFVALLRQTSAFGSLVPGMVFLGIGVGLFYSSVTTAALTSMDPSRSSLAGGLLYMFQIAGGAVGLALSTTVFLLASSNEIQDGAAEVGIDLSTSEIDDIQGVLAGTDTSAELLEQFPSQADQLTEIVRDAFVSGMRWTFSFDAALTLIGLGIAIFAVAGPVSRFLRDVPGREEAAQR
jgi:hypothetical protein